MKIGDEVWVKDGSNLSRNDYPKKPLLIKVSEFGGTIFFGDPVDESLPHHNFLYDFSEIFSAEFLPKRKKGKFIGERLIQ